MCVCVCIISNLLFVFVCLFASYAWAWQYVIGLPTSCFSVSIHTLAHTYTERSAIQLRPLELFATTGIVLRLSSTLLLVFLLASMQFQWQLHSSKPLSPPLPLLLISWPCVRPIGQLNLVNYVKSHDGISWPPKGLLCALVSLAKLPKLPPTSVSSRNTHYF